MAAVTSPFRPDILKDKVVLVTGGGTGICHGIARSMGQHGARLALMGRRADVLEAAVAGFAQEGIEALAVAGDVRDFASAEQAVTKAASRWGRLDILVNGAAGNFLCPAEELSANAFRTVIDIDLVGTFDMCKAALPHLKKSGSGFILNISMTLHYVGTPMQAHASAAKAGVDALTVALATEWGPFGIRVCGIAPGPIGDTEGMRRLAPSGADKKLAKTIPLGRLGAINDVALAALFLASDAASYVTGDTLVVDGGQWFARPPMVPPELLAQNRGAKT